MHRDGHRTIPGVANGLGLIAGLAVIPHFDQMERWRPGALEWFAAWQPAGTTLVGIDEDTALVRGGRAVAGPGGGGGVGPRRRPPGPVRGR